MHDIASRLPNVRRLDLCTTNRWIGARQISRDFTFTGFKITSEMLKSSCSDHFISLFLSLLNVMEIWELHVACSYIQEDHRLQVINDRTYPALPSYLNDTRLSFVNLHSMFSQLDNKSVLKNVTALSLFHLGHVYETSIDPDYLQFVETVTLMLQHTPHLQHIALGWWENTIWPLLDLVSSMAHLPLKSIELAGFYFERCADLKDCLLPFQNTLERAKFSYTLNSCTECEKPKFWHQAQILREEISLPRLRTFLLRDDRSEDFDDCGGDWAPFIMGKEHVNPFDAIGSRTLDDDEGEDPTSGGGNDIPGAQVAADGNQNDGSEH